MTMWPMATQHFARAVNGSPWSLRYGDKFTGTLVPFGAKILFWNSPDRADKA